MGWETWWLWFAGGLILLIAEVLLPGYVALGIGLGAFAVGAVLLLVGLDSLAVALVIWAVASVLAWVALRRWAGERKGQVRIWTTDIND